MMGELRSLAMISGGMVLGSMGGKAIDNMLNSRKLSSLSHIQLNIWIICRYPYLRNKVKV